MNDELASSHEGANVISYPEWLKRNETLDDQGLGFSELNAEFLRLKNIIEFGLSINVDKLVSYLSDPNAALEEDFVTVGESQVQAEVDPYMSDALQQNTPEELIDGAKTVLLKIKELIKIRGMQIEQLGFKTYIDTTLSAPPAGD